MSAPHPETTRHDALVIGGGVLGATLALFLARGGMTVALVERDALARAASGVNAGTLTMQMTRVALIPYALQGHALWARARDWLGHDVGVTVCDGLSLAFTEAEAEVLHHRAGLRREAGAPIQIVSPTRAREIEPGLSTHPILAAHCPVDGHAQAYLTGRSFRRALQEAGVHLLEHTPVEGIEPDGTGYTARLAGGGRIAGRRLALCGGVWTETLCAWLGIDLAIKVLVNQVGVTEPMAPVMRTVLGIASGLLSLKQFANGSVVIGGGWQGMGDRERGAEALRPEALVGNLRLACHAVPALRQGRLLRAWAGLEAETADAMPAVGPLPGLPEAFVCASVHSGYTSGPYIATLLAEHMLGREPALPLFPVERLLDGGMNSLRATG
ncbi:MAG: FAD-dependent oxidoreductase [Pseudomonadota bacterium]